MRVVCGWVLVAALGATAAGCQGVAMPRLGCPGPAEYQQARAQRFDPYPENEPGPVIVGGRPMQYDKPPAEVQRARWFPANWASR